MGWLAGKRPTDLGVRGGRLKPAPSTPNAVHSQAKGGVHAIEPLGYRASREDAMEAIARIVAGMKGARIVARSDDYLYAEFETAWLGFVDDVEFYAPPETKVVHVRSASRLGHSDLGVNRRRVEAIRARFSERGL